MKKLRMGFTLVEMMMSLGCGSLILASVVTAGVCLQRSFAAMEGYSIAEGDQLRVLDYIAMDTRRAKTATITYDVNGNPTALTLTVWAYYQANGTPYDPVLSSGAVQYNSGATYTIQYSQSGSTFVRTVGPTSTWPTGNTATAIATNVSSFTMVEAAAGNPTSNVTCYITFSPRFVYVPGPGPIAGTTVYINTFLRNAGAR